MKINLSPVWRALLGTTLLGTGGAYAQDVPPHPVISTSPDGQLLVIMGTPLDDNLEIRNVANATGLTGWEIISHGQTIFRLPPQGVTRLQVCQANLGAGNDRLIVTDTPMLPIKPVQWMVNGDEGDDVIALSSPLQGTTNDMIARWQMLAPQVGQGREDLAGKAEKLMAERLRWAEAQVTNLAVGQSAAFQARANALVERVMGDAPGSVLSQAAGKFKQILGDTATHGLEQQLERKQWSEEGGIPYDGMAPLYNADPVLEQIAQAEARLLSTFSWLPADGTLTLEDGGDAGLEGSTHLARSLAIADDIAYSMDGLGDACERGINAAITPVVNDMLASSEFFTAESNLLATQLTDHTVDLSSIESRVTEGPLGTVLLENDLAAFDAAAQQSIDAGMATGDAGLMAILQDLEGLEAQLRPLFDGMDLPDAPAGGLRGGTTAAGLTMPVCNITTTNNINGGPGLDFLFGTPANDLISAGAGVDFAFGMRGDDIIQGDAGVDFLFGMRGNDDISGGDDTDLIFGDAFFWTGDDCLHGNDGIDIVLGEKGDDGLEGGDKLDLLIGGSDTDIMLGDDGNDIMLGWTGNDQLDGGKESDLMLGDYPLAPAGNDTLVGSSGTSITIAGVGYELGDIQIGNDGLDSITGGSGIDFQMGNLGNDTMDGAANFDIMFGGNGQDTMEGELGGTLLVINGVPIRIGNFMWGNQDMDTMRGGGDMDFMFGGDEDDSLTGGKNSSFHLLGIDMDFIFGNAGDDYADGHHRTDFIFGNTGADTLHGDLGLWYQLNSNDFVFGNDGPDRIFGGNGNDFCFGNADNDVIDGEWNLLLDVLFGNDGQDTVDGNGGNDLIFGNDDADVLLGGNGILDILFGNAGPDTIHGQGGIDLIFGNTGADNIFGGGFADIIFGNEDDDIIHGEDFPDLIFGNSGCDKIFGGNGPDLVFGNAGDDLIHGDDGPDLLFGNEGNDDVYGDASVDMLFGNDDHDTMFGGTGWDLCFGNLGNDEIHGDSGLDVIFGNDGDDCLYGEDDVDSLFGGSGNDNIHGGSHLDTISGGDGNDCLFGENAVDLIWGGDGDDDIYGGNSADAIWGGSGNDSIRSEDGSDAVNGGDGDDDINAGSTTDVLIFGNEGNDRMHGDSGNDWMFGNGGHDRMWGNDGNDKLWGNSGNDMLDGGNGNDYLAGGSGNDGLYGGPGIDVLIGGGGSDTKSQNGSQPEDSQREAACGRICGKKWHDLNRNGVWDGGEPGLAGVVIYLDLNNNNAFNPGEPTMVTMADNPATCDDETGCYCFYGLRPGVYTVRELVPSGFIITYPANNGHQFYLSPGEKRDGVNFGNARPQQCFFTVRGCKFLDKDRDGILDPGEILLPGVTIYHDANGNGIKDPTEMSTVTGPDGCYALNFPFNGTVYITQICEVVPPGYIPTVPSNGCRTIDVFACGEAPFHVNFGNFPHQIGPVIIVGNGGTTAVFVDANGDGKQQPTEPGLAGVTIWSDTNGNGQQDADEFATQTAGDDATTPEDETGTVIIPAAAASGELHMVIPAGYAIVSRPGMRPSTTAPLDGNTGLMPDADGDATGDVIEQNQGTNPALADSDGDGLSDGQERALQSDPNDTDTDNDGLTDGYEFTHHIPLTDADSDDDGLSDGQEVTQRTNPLHADSDHDGISDAAELQSGGNPAVGDTDNDGLSDAEELALGTNARNADSDGDGDSDMTETLRGTNPQSALDNSRDTDQPRNGRIAQIEARPAGKFCLTVMKFSDRTSVLVRHSVDLVTWDETIIQVPEGSSAEVEVPANGKTGFYQAVVP